MPSSTSDTTSVITLVADGARPDVLAAALDSGRLPALARLRREGWFGTVTTAFPSVTGPAYTPFLLGRHPASVGLPGLRWFDRSRRVAGAPSYSRSYVGIDMRRVDGDLDESAPTMFELAHPSLGALSVIRRGLGESQRIGRGIGFILRTARTHFRGNLDGWLSIDGDVGTTVVHAVREMNPRFVFAAFTGADKASHSAGADAPAVIDAFAIVDEVAARIRADAERAGRWPDMHLWVVSDHGHSQVQRHDDLADVVRATGRSVLTHPWAYNARADVAVMVSGNAMAHLYVGLADRKRRFWSTLGETWNDLADAILTRESVDLMLLPISDTECEVRTRDRGAARVVHAHNRYSYIPAGGDPLGLGELRDMSEQEAYEVTRTSDYPDSLVQITRVTACERSGDIILSAARSWDLRARYEPIPHVSSHGALHRDHMLVPLLLSRAPRSEPRRTVDIMPSACEALGITPPFVEGTSFL